MDGDAGGLMASPVYIRMPSKRHGMAWHLCADVSLLYSSRREVRQFG